MGTFGGSTEHEKIHRLGIPMPGWESKLAKKVKCTRG
jgi:hypothetical protein